MYLQAPNGEPDAEPDAARQVNWKSPNLLKSF